MTVLTQKNGKNLCFGEKITPCSDKQSGLREKTGIKACFDGLSRKQQSFSLKQSGTKGLSLSRS